MTADEADELAAGLRKASRMARDLAAAVVGE
jgi:hypothetical protein